MRRAVSVIVTPAYMRDFERAARRAGHTIRLLSKRGARGYTYEVRGPSADPLRVRRLPGVCSFADDRPRKPRRDRQGRH